MILRHVCLYLDPVSYQGELEVAFGFHTRCLCNFLERRLSVLKFKADGFSRICVKGVATPRSGCPVLGEQAAVVEARFDRDHFEKLTKEEYSEFFLSMLGDGLKECGRHHKIPSDFLVAAMNEFRTGGYKNEWVHEKKLLKPFGLRATLKCALTMDAFILLLVLEKGEDVIFSKPLVQTKPDEIIFHHQFKELRMRENILLLYDRSETARYALRLPDLVELNPSDVVGRNQIATW
jgi:hypothetical protein